MGARHDLSVWLQVCLLENVRFHEGETSNDASFTASLARLADVFINDAFGVAHRDQSSVTVSGWGLTHGAWLSRPGCGCSLQQGRRMEGAMMAMARRSLGCS